MALRDGIIVCGAPGYDVMHLDQGAAFVFEKQAGNYTLSGFLTDPNAQAGDALGAGVAVSGLNIAVGATDTQEAGAKTGAAILFRKTGLGWESMERVTAHDASSDSQFGDAMDIEGERMIICAPTADEGAANAGTGYSFELAHGHYRLMGFGDGSQLRSPCGNDSISGLYQGAVNSTGFGGRLTPAGSDVLADDELRFTATNLLPLSPALLFAGSTEAPPFGLGDGLMASEGPFVRFGVTIPTASGNATWESGFLGQTPWNPGDKRYFQVWYRDNFGSPCGNGFNTTGAVEVTFQ